MHIICCNAFSLTSVVSRTFSTLCMYSKFGHHPHPLGYLCAKFCFFRGLCCSASAWRKMAYSITHSLTQLICCNGNQSLCFGITRQFYKTWKRTTPGHQKCTELDREPSILSWPYLVWSWPRTLLFWPQNWIWFINVSKCTKITNFVKFPKQLIKYRSCSHTFGTHRRAGRKAHKNNASNT